MNRPSIFIKRRIFDVLLLATKTTLTAKIHLTSSIAIIRGHLILWFVMFIFQLEAITLREYWIKITFARCAISVFFMLDNNVSKFSQMASITDQKNEDEWQTISINFNIEPSRVN